MNDEPYNVLFVCTGNTCRSPMAEKIFRDLTQDKISVRSAGLLATAGNPASPEAVRVLKEIDLDLSTHQSTPLTEMDIIEADWVLVMTHSHLDMLHQLYPEKQNIALLSSFSATGDKDILDPVGGSLDLYRKTRDEIRTAITDFILLLNEEDIIN